MKITNSLFTKAKQQKQWMSFDQTKKISTVKVHCLLKTSSV